MTNITQQEKEDEVDLMFADIEPEDEWQDKVLFNSACWIFYKIPNLWNYCVLMAQRGALYIMKRNNRPFAIST